jgi:hypothetical protein
MFSKFIANFKESYAKHSATSSIIMSAPTPHTPPPVPIITVPASSSLFTEIKNEVKKLESDIFYSTETTIANLKSEVEKLYAFASSSYEKYNENETKIVVVNHDAAVKIAALQVENANYSSSIARSNDLITRLNSVVGS